MFRFTIRDLLWLMVVVGLSAGWWAAERLRGPENALLRQEVLILLQRDAPLEAKSKEEHIKKLMFIRQQKWNLEHARNRQELETAIKSAEESIQYLRSKMTSEGPPPATLNDP